MRQQNYWLHYFFFINNLYTLLGSLKTFRIIWIYESQKTRHKFPPRWSMNMQLHLLYMTVTCLFQHFLSSGRTPVSWRTAWRGCFPGGRWAGNGSESSVGGGAVCGTGDWGWCAPGPCGKVQTPDWGPGSNPPADCSPTWP